MDRVVLSILAVLGIIYVIPFFIYGVLSSVGWIEKPKGPPSAFLIGVLVSKTGTAIAFVLLLYLGRGAFGGEWLLYALVWWIMFVFGEVGQVIGPNYSWKEAVAGIVSETIYFPLSAYLVFRLIP